MSYIYLASPYSHPDTSIRRLRYKAAVDAVAHLVNRGYIVYSPIAHFHPIAELHELPGDYLFWSRHNIALLRTAQALHVLQLPGWKHSTGVREEIGLAESLHIPVRYYTQEELPE